ncbi:primosomal protein N' [Nocardia jinanensis]|uniref:primosomal protein N' n=1 Tax=Nocardia jinanensis TaxID=382504 RepID=UPI001E56EDD1|nr:primosomal protein N' [Nocardia jinanensis]
MEHPVARVLPLLTPAHLDRDFDYLVPPELDEIARPGVRVRVRFAGRLVDGYLLSRLAESDHPGKLVRLERVVSAEQVLTPEILRLATTVAARCAGTRADVLRLAVPPRHARVENGGPAKKSADSDGEPASPADGRGSIAAGSGRAADRDTPRIEDGTGRTAAAPEYSVEPGGGGGAGPVDADGDPVEPGGLDGVGASENDDTEQGGSESPGELGPTAVPGGVDTLAWRRYRHGDAFLTALASRRGPRAAWQALPGENWARRLAELAAVVAASGRSAILMVPDQRDLDRVLRECVLLVGDSAVGLSAGLGPAARYRRWLAVLRGTASVVVGTRSAVFAPAVDLGLVAIWDDGDDTYAEPRAPYPHAREIAMLRAHDTGAAFVAAGFARTAEIQAVVESGWAHDLLADRATLRAASPRIAAPGDTDAALERDPMARAIRIPAAAFAAARQALAAGAGVLVQVPRRGYVPALACTKCRTPARCRRCVGPLSLPGSDRSADSGAAHSPVCRWCGRTEAAFRCPVCGGRVLRAVVIGAARTAEELGRAFPGVPIRGSSGAALLDTVPPGPQVVVATVGAEPLLDGGYGVGLLLDGWALLGRADLRAAEDTLRRWLSAAALVRPDGQVLVMADPAVPTVQALLRWDPAGHAATELAQRTEVGFPPAVRMAAVDGTPDGIAGLLAAAELSAEVEVLGPVPLPPGARPPSGARNGGDEPGAEVERILLRAPRARGAALARALAAAQSIRSSQRAESPPRVQIDPLDIG